MQNQDISSEVDSRLKWYTDAKFGLFIHWGAYTVAGAEASWPIMAPRLSEAMFGTPSTVSEAEYIKLPARFNPIEFDADTWVKTAKDSGMKYIVITSKHHDGFCMFDAPGTDYKITNTPFKRDVCLELAEACKKNDMRLGFYYSPPDMMHPGYRDTSKPMTKNWLGEPKRKEWAEYLDYMESHIVKLLTDYGDVSLLWFDGLCNHAKYETERFHKLIHELSPNTLINDRLGDGYDFVTPEQFIPTKGIPIKSGMPPASNSVESEKFFRTVIRMFKIPVIRGWIKKQMHKYAEGTLELTPVTQESYPEPKRFQPWETCMTIGESWAFNPKESNWKAPGTLVRNLSNVVGHGGNYLLNVGPTDQGIFPKEAKERLDYIGKWIASNSEAVYSNTYTHLNNMPWGTITKKDRDIYLHISDWPQENSITINDFPWKAREVLVLRGDTLSFEQKEGEIKISLPKTAPDSDVSVIKVKIGGNEEAAIEDSTPQPTGKAPKEYIRKSAIVSAVINGVANGLIALFSYRLVSAITAIDSGIDVLITVAIISFLTSWLVVSGTRKDIAGGKVALPMSANANKNTKRPMNSALRALIIMFIMVVGLGGVLNAFIFLAIPNGFSGWGYIVFKTLYTSLCGALSVVVSIKSVLREIRIKK